MYHHLFEAIGDSIIVSVGVARNNVSNNTRNSITNHQIHVGFLVINTAAPWADQKTGLWADQKTALWADKKAALWAD